MLPAEIAAEFRRQFTSEPKLYRAPGRVNLIGEHTDYNDGLVMPAAIPLHATVAIARRKDRRVRARSLNFDETIEFALPADGDAAGFPLPSRHWGDYVRGVALMLCRAGLLSSGADLLIHGAVPLGSGLSSSAALEVATGFALAHAGGAYPDRTQLALLCRQAENDYVGTRCGIMDQFASACAEQGHALLLDCRTLQHEPVRVVGARVVVCNTMVRHKLAAGEYNRRREECERAVARLAAVSPGVRSLRDLTGEQLREHRAALDPLLLRRARHVIDENARVLAFRDALAEGKLAHAGMLMNRSHASLRDDFQVSCPELDLMVRLAEPLDGVFGARMTGGGFGGCTVNLVRPDAVERFSAVIAEQYARATGHRPQVYTFDAAAGAGPVEP